METQNKNTVVLEPSSNTHILTTEKAVKTKPVSGYPEMLIVEVEGQGIVTHGEHGTVVTEHKHVIKTVQKEYNPVTRLMANAFD